MQRRLAQASVVFTTAVVGPGETPLPHPPPPRHERRRSRHPLRPPLSSVAPGPYRRSCGGRSLAAFPHPSFPLLPSFPRRRESRTPPLPSFLRRQEPRPTHLSLRGEGRRAAAGEGALAWRKPVFPAHMKALAAPRSNDGAKVAGSAGAHHARPRRWPPPRRRGRARGSHARHFQAHPSPCTPRLRCQNRFAWPSPVAQGRGRGNGRSRNATPCNRMRHPMNAENFETLGHLAALMSGSRPWPWKHPLF